MQLTRRFMLMALASLAVPAIPAAFVDNSLGDGILHPARIAPMHSIEKEGGFNPSDVSPEKAAAARPFAILRICGTHDSTIPCRHSERIEKSAIGPKELWIVKGAGHAAALGQVPAEYDARVVKFFETYPKNP